MYGRIRLLLASLLTLSVAPGALADEGLWMVQDLGGELEAKMRSAGLRLGADAIFNGDGPGTTISDAVVSLDFKSNGCLVSDKGLVLSNRHTAYTHLARIPESRASYLQTGFWAKSARDELPLEGERAYLLKRVFDITEKTNEYADARRAQGQVPDFEEIEARIVDYYTAATGLHCIVRKAWGGERRSLYAYKVYSDVRLVAVPPATVTDFGGEADHLAWPRHSADFALLRLYEDGKPVSGEPHLSLSLKGYGPGSFAMALGHPSQTSRHSSPARLRQEMCHVLPLANKLRRARLEIVRSMMEEDNEVRAKYFDKSLDLEMAIKEGEGRIASFHRFALDAQKELRQARLSEWIRSESSRMGLWGDLGRELEEAYSRTTKTTRSKVVFEEGVSHSSFLAEALVGSLGCGSLIEAKSFLLDWLSLTDEGVEKALLERAVEVFYTSLESDRFGKYQKWLYNRFGHDFKAMARFLWSGSAVASEERVKALESMDELLEDPIARFLTGCLPEAFEARDASGDGIERASLLDKEYGRVVHLMDQDSGRLDYPDADSSMRLSFGTVGSYLPHDGVTYKYLSTTRGILEKAASRQSSDRLDESLASSLQRKSWGKWDQQGVKEGLPVCFLSDLDVAGGFAGAPVINADGAVIGLASGSTTEGLGGEVSYSSFYNKCVSTDVRYVMWILDKRAKLRRVVKEISIAE